jgi:hypothetical protein
VAISKHEWIARRPEGITSTNRYEPETWIFRG